MYGKIFESIFKSTLVAEGGFLPTYVFMSMVTLADKDGVVDVAPPALFTMLGFQKDGLITYQDFLSSIEYLEKDDPNSNSPKENGRRIVPLNEINEINGNRGWVVVNYLEYRKKASKMEDRGSSTERVRRWRERQKMKRDVTECNGNETDRNGHTDTDTDKTYNIPYRDIVSYLNEKSNKNFKPTTKPTRSAIKARFNEGFTISDFHQVIDNKCAKWKTDPKMVDYLRPQTLFGTKFESYLQESGPVKKQLIGVPIPDEA